MISATAQCTPTRTWHQRPGGCYSPQALQLAPLRLRLSPLPRDPAGYKGHGTAARAPSFAKTKCRLQAPHLARVGDAACRRGPGPSPRQPRRGPPGRRPRRRVGPLPSGPRRLPAAAGAALARASARENRRPPAGGLKPRFPPIDRPAPTRSISRGHRASYAGMRTRTLLLLLCNKR